MLLSFAVENFRSIATRQELSMLALPLSSREGEVDNVVEEPKYGYKILKSAVIYGANASGKSNLIKAMDRMALMATKSIDFKVHHQLWHEPFLLSNATKHAPTKFVMTLIAEDHVLYEYGFAYDVEGIWSEHLYSWPNHRKTRLFERQKSKIKFGTTFTGDKKILQETLLHNHLLLTKAANSNYKEVQPVYNFFALQLKIILETRHLIETENAAFANSEMKAQIRSMMKAADTGIEDFNVQVAHDIFETSSGFSEGNSGYHKPVKLETQIVHRFENHELRWPIYNESDGTQRLFKLAGPILNAINTGSTFIMDELNSSLHPEICRFIVRAFHSSKAKQPAQLIFSTHDTSIMTSELFRRDQIWFTEKNKKEGTELFSLSSFDKDKVRHNTPYDKWYLSGRFGAIPILADLETSGTHE